MPKGASDPLDHLIRDIYTTPGSLEVKGCKVNLVYIDRRYDPKDEYYAGIPATGKEPIINRSIFLSENMLSRGEEYVRKVVSTKIQRHLREQFVSPTFPVLAGFEYTISVPIYNDPTFKEDCQLVIPEFFVINEELIAYLAAHPNFLHQMDWRKFEELLASIFKNQGFNVELGPGRGDGGVDLRLIHKDSIGPLLTLVQAKRYKRKNKIKLEAVAALEGILDANQAHRGLFVTTSEFLPSARQFAEKESHRLRLAAENEIILWLKQYGDRGKPQRS